jgi:hypothetical protein
MRDRVSSVWMRRSKLGFALPLVTLLLLASLSGPSSAASTYDILVSTASSRSNALPLAGRTVSGNIYAFTSPDTPGILRVRFYLDNPSATGTPRGTENNPPYDFAGGTVSTASPFNTTAIADGAHTITAAVDLTNGTTEVVSSSFTVRNTNAAFLAFSPTSLNFVKASGDGPSSQTSQLTTNNGSAASFSLTENASWLTISPTSGASPDPITVTADAAGLSPGTYTTAVIATAPGYGSATLSVSLTVRGPPDQIHLAWTSDPSTTLTVVWHTWETTTPSVVEFRKKGDTAWSQATGALRASGTTGTLHQVTLTSLLPVTAYEYRVRGDGTFWSGIRETRTAPSAGSGDVDFIYVADTGLIGRTDGLATGTQQVVNEIAALKPLLVLGGGDYAYYDTDKRYGTLNNTIDAWFNQMQPVAAASPLMPVYGNHEILLGEGYEPWSARFATPAGIGGSNNRQNYSFDVGDVHFVAIMAVSDTDGLTSSVLQWIDQDLQNAKAAGKRWLIPYFHVPAFGDGGNHPENRTLRGQLAPIFERHGVKLAIASHDQAYERSYPLTNATASGYTITSSSKSCYTLADGVTWVKVSPGGKRSNINGNFSAFRTSPAPSWTAFRDNTVHHFSRVTVKPSGTLHFETHGVKGDGSPPVVQDAFEYRSDGCPITPALSFSPNTVSLSAAQGGSSVSKTTTLATNTSSVASYAVSDNAPWLTVAPVSGQTPGNLTLTANPSGLAPGTYSATVTATAAGYTSATSNVTFIVTGSTGSGFSILTSSAASRTNPVQLAGRTVTGNIHAFTSPDVPGILRVRFYLDNPGATGTPRSTENNPPYDFAGGTVSTASPFNTAMLANGSHTITAAIDRTNGTTELVSAAFVASN